MRSRFSLEGMENKLEDVMRGIMQGMNGLKRIGEDVDIIVGGRLDYHLNGQKLANSSADSVEGEREGKTSEGGVRMYEEAAMKKREFGTISLILGTGLTFCAKFVV